MAISFSKREKEKKKQSKRLAKQKRKEERKENKKETSFEDMIAYVDENGMITDTPPDTEHKKEEIKLEDIAVSTPKKEELEQEETVGRVEFFNESKGYGFIKDMNNGEKYFFHVSSLIDDIKEGNMVTYELERGQRGLNAFNVKLHVPPQNTNN